MAADTPAGARLSAYLETKDFTESPFDPLDPDEMAAVVLNIVHVDASAPVKALAGVLQGEFPVFQASGETWDRVAKSIQVKLEGVGIFLLDCNIRNLSEEEE